MLTLWGCASATPGPTPPPPGTAPSLPDYVTHERPERIAPATKSYADGSLAETFAQLRDRMYVIGETSGDLQKWNAEVEGAAAHLAWWMKDPAHRVELTQKLKKYTPLGFAVREGWAPVVEVLLTFEEVRKGLETPQDHGFTPWQLANIAPNLALLVVNRSLKGGNPFALIPYMVKLPYFAHGGFAPYARTRLALERAGAKVDVAALKKALLGMKLLPKATRKALATSKDVLVTLRELVMAEVGGELRKLAARRKAKEKARKEGCPNLIKAVCSGVPDCEVWRKHFVALVEKATPEQRGEECGYALIDPTVLGSYRIKAARMHAKQGPWGKGGPVTFERLEALEDSSCPLWSMTKKQALCFELKEDLAGTNVTAVFVPLGKGRQRRIKLIASKRPGSASSPLLKRTKGLAKLNKALAKGAFGPSALLLTVAPGKTGTRHVYGDIIVARSGRVEFNREGAVWASATSGLSQRVADKAGEDGIFVWEAGKNYAIVFQMNTDDNVNATEFVPLVTTPNKDGKKKGKKR